MSKFGEVGKVILDTNLGFFSSSVMIMTAKKSIFFKMQKLRHYFLKVSRVKKKEIFGGFAKKLYLCLVVLEFGLFSHRNTKTSETHTKNGSVAE